jgi:hypothetical protein
MEGKIMKETREEILDALEIVVTALYDKLDYLKENEPDAINSIERIRETLNLVTDFECEI